jgi:toxin ParE1/3/4
MPSSRSIRISPEADLDFQGIAHYTLLNWDQQQLIRYYDELFGTMERLARYPELGRRRSEFVTGLFSFAASSHVIYYSFDEFDLTIHRVLHARREPAPNDFSGS